MSFQIDHLGIAVKSLAAAMGIFEKVGLTASPEQTVAHEQVRLVMVLGRAGWNCWKRLPRIRRSPKFIAKRGEGLHHVCVKVPDLGAAADRLKIRWRAPVIG